MKSKNKITEDNYQEIVLKRSIIICWILLAICLVIKLFGGNFFGIVCENENFIGFCNFIDQYQISAIFRFLSFMVSSILVMKIVNYESKTLNTIAYTFLCFAYWCFKHLIEVDIIQISTLLYNIIDSVSLYVLILIVINKHQPKWKIFLKPLLAVIILLVFSFVSAFVKNIGINARITSSFLTGFIFMIDYYIMLILTYLYVKRRYK